MSGTQTTVEATNRKVEKLRSGNGEIGHVAAFFKVSSGTVANWKDKGLLGHFFEGRNVWFSPDDVADFGASRHRTGKFSHVTPAQVREQVKAEWISFMGAIVQSAELENKYRGLIVRVQALEKVCEKFESPHVVSYEERGVAA